MNDIPFADYLRGDKARDYMARVATDTIPD
jgi:hypothetical protein